jgi:hypothetical protein
VELIPEPFAFAAAGFDTAGTFDGLLVLEFAALIGCRSRRESSASVFEPALGALVAGATVEDLPLGIADSGVSGLVATFVGSGPALADVA